jgi:hypothetical protein
MGSFVVGASDAASDCAVDKARLVLLLLLLLWDMKFEYCLNIGQDYVKKQEQNKAKGI